MTFFISGDDIQKFADENAPVDRVEQNTGYFCGAACTAMLLKKFGVLVDQPTIYQNIHDDDRFKTEQMYSDPLGISGYLSRELNQVCTISSVDGFDNCIREILKTIEFLQFPCITLVQAGNHWIVIDTIRVVEDADGTQTVIGAFIENPWYNKTPHSYVAVNELQENWIKPNQWGATWKNKFICISGAATKKTSRAQIQKVRIVPGYPRSRVTNTMVNAGSGSPADLVDLAIQNMRQHGFTTTTAISGGGALITNPIRVLNTEKNQFFWIVPVDATKESTLREFSYVAIDAISGALLEVARMEVAMDVLNDSELAHLLALTFPRALVDIDPQYYWVPSYETMSRFDVIRRAKVNSQEYYVLKGGTIVNSLTLTPSSGG
jgi:hypothetical protein